MVVLDEITAGIQEVAKGELSHRIEVKTADEFGVVVREHQSDGREGC